MWHLLNKVSVFKRHEDDWKVFEYLLTLVSSRCFIVNTVRSDMVDKLF